MSTKETRKARVKVALACVTVVIPFPLTIWGIWFTNMREMGVILVGLWVFCWEIIAANREWKNEFIQRWTRKPWIWVAMIALTFAATGWVARSVHKPVLMDPEATENKYIRVTSIPSPDPEFEYAVLIEFGAKQVNSEGFIAGVQPYGGDQRHWYGAPGRTDVQTEFDMTHGGPEAGILWTRMPEFTVSPRTSYYLCVMAHTAEQCEPNDILYFAVASNARALQSRTKIIGHQYQRDDK